MDPEDIKLLLSALTEDFTASEINDSEYMLKELEFLIGAKGSFALTLIDSLRKLKALEERELQ